MKKGTTETAVGIFMIIGLACLAYLAVHLGNLGWFEDDRYTVQALFTSVSGLKQGADVEIAGVPIGQVAHISLDHDSQMALVDLSIEKEVTLTDDVIASIKTSGLIGDKFVKLSPGSSTTPLKPGAVIMDTESALDIEELIGKFVFGKIK